MAKAISGIGLEDVKAVYSGPEGDLWELVMGQQIHIGGFKSSMDLAEKAGIAPGTRGVDLCCCNGAGMRFLLRFREVAHMHGVDATAKVIERAEKLCADENLSDRVTLVLADACDTGLPDANMDFVWGEDAWCYVEDKPALIAEAARLVKPGGAIAFTDWIEGERPLSDSEAERFLRFMKFPNIEDLSGYRSLLETNGCEVLSALDTGRFAPCVDLYVNMLDTQLTSDALRILGYDTSLLNAAAEEMLFIRQIAREGKVAQGLFVARKR